MKQDHTNGIEEDGSINEDYFICYICSLVLHENEMIGGGECKCKQCEY